MNKVAYKKHHFLWYNLQLPVIICIILACYYIYIKTRVKWNSNRFHQLILHLPLFYQWTDLHTAAGQGDVDTVKFIADKVDDIDVKDKNGVSRGVLLTIH